MKSEKEGPSIGMSGTTMTGGVKQKARGEDEDQLARVDFLEDDHL